MFGGILKGAWGLIRNTGKYGTGAAVTAGVGAAGMAASGTLSTSIEDLVNFSARTSGGATPEAGFQKFYKFLEKIGEFIMMLTHGQYGQGLIDFGKKGMDQRSPEEKLSDASPLSPERAGQRVDIDGTRFAIDGPNGSPPSVKFSTEEATVANTANLIGKGVKDGLGVVAGGVMGSLSWIADKTQLDKLVLGKEVENSFSGTYDAVAGAVNNATDYAVYNIGGTLLTPTHTLVNVLKGQSLSEAFSNAWDANYEPTIRSDADLAIYNGVSRTSGAVIGGLGVGFGAAALGVGGATTVTGGSVIGNTFGQAVSGLKGVASSAGSLASMVPSFRGNGGPPTITLDK